MQWSLLNWPVSAKCLRKNPTVVSSTVSSTHHNTVSCTMILSQREEFRSYAHPFDRTGYWLLQDPAQNCFQVGVIHTWVPAWSFPQLSFRTLRVFQKSLLGVFLLCKSHHARGLTIFLHNNINPDNNNNNNNSNNNNNKIVIMTICIINTKMLQRSVNKQILKMWMVFKSYFGKVKKNCQAFAKLGKATQTQVVGVVVFCGCREAF